MLEVDLRRGEARLAQLAAQSSQDAESSHHPGAGQDSIALGLDTPTAEPETKDEGRQRWEDYLRERFIHGEDDDFDYSPVDTDDALDVMERREEEEAWFNDEEPQWSTDVDSSGDSGGKKLEGETGIQDF